MDFSFGIKERIAYAKTVFDSNSPASFGRHACAVVIAWVLSAATCVMLDDVIKGRDLFIPDCPQQWVYIIGLLFGIAAGKEGLQSFAAPKTTESKTTESKTTESKTTASQPKGEGK
jgi:hypothetical protein